jgi:hypothetical protein
MGVYLYCMTPPQALPGPHLAGIRGDPVSSFTAPDLTLWVDLQETAPPATLESVKAHHAVVRAAWSAAPACLPARFGQWFPDRAGLEERVTRIGPALERALLSVRGAGEHGIRVLDPETGEESRVSEPVPPRTGREYLESLERKNRARETRGDRARALAGRLEAALDGVVRAQRAEPLLTRHGLLSVAHLVSSDREEAYAKRLADFREEHQELRFLVTGPWPPYSFAP